MTGLDDPLGSAEFAGDEDEVAAIAGYTMAMSELRKRVQLGVKSTDDDETVDKPKAKAKAKADDG